MDSIAIINDLMITFKVHSDRLDSTDIHLQFFLHFNATSQSRSMQLWNVNDKRYIF